MTPSSLPQSVRYVKNGGGGRWWKAARASNQVHLGWSRVPQELLRSADLEGINALDQSVFGAGQGEATRDRNALLTLIDRPSRHIWITFQDGFLWWCLVKDEVETNPAGESREHGHFWLTCARPWSNLSIGGRPLATADLPGTATTTAGYQATVCEPTGWATILRIISDEPDADVASAAEARKAYEAAIQTLVARLHPKDFEVLIDLIFARTGWARVAKLGGATEGTDMEVENVTSGEIAFVQVKSSAGQRVLDDYVVRFSARRERYARMIFAVHTPKGTLRLPAELPVQIWNGERIAELVVALGLGEWLARHL